MQRAIDINLVTKIEYATFPTEADMNLYEIYFINKLKPPLNIDDKTRDELTVELPYVEFKTFECHLWERWKQEINAKNDEYSIKRDRYNSIYQEHRILRNKLKMEQITKDEYCKQLDLLNQEKDNLKKYLFGN